MNDSLFNEELSELLRLAERASLGPWEVAADGIVSSVLSLTSKDLITSGFWCTHEDQKYMAFASPDRIMRLINKVYLLKESVSALEDRRG